jgi:hypothetical protein
MKNENNNYIRFNITHKKQIQTYRMPKYIYLDFITYVLKEKKRYKPKSREYKELNKSAQLKIEEILNNKKNFKGYNNFTYHLTKLLYEYIYKSKTALEAEKRKNYIDINKSQNEEINRLNKEFENLKVGYDKLIIDYDKLDNQVSDYDY